MKQNKQHMRQTIGIILVLSMLLGGMCVAQAESVYKLGDTLEDFSVTLADGTEVTLSGLLQDKKAVLINFWATWCGPCLREFPFMQEAYEQMQDDIAIIALSISADDTNEAIVAFQKENGLEKLPMGADTLGLNERFVVTAIPTSVMVDRNGVICLISKGGIDETAVFLDLFRTFTTEEYDQPLLLTNLPVLPTAENPSSVALSKALNAPESTFEFACSDFPYDWPFVPDDEGASSSNAGIPGSQSVVYMQAEVGEGQALAFDYRASLIPAVDALRVDVNGKNALYISESTDRETGYVLFDEAGTYTLSFRFIKDPGGSMDDAQDTFTDSVTLSNVRFVPLEEAAASQETLPRALEGKNADIEILNDEGRWVQFTLSEGGSGKALIANGTVLKIRLLLGKELNPHAARFMCDSGYISMLSNMPYDEYGYLVDVELHTEPNSVNLLAMEPSLADGEGEMGPYMAFPTEEAFVAFFDLATESSQQTYTWEYME